MSNFLAAIVGAVVGGGFLLIAQRLQFRAQGRAAGRALLVEMSGNAKLTLRILRIVKMAGHAAGAPADELNLSRIQELLLKHYSDRVWSTQLPLVADRFDWAVLDRCREAYSYASDYLYSLKWDAGFLDKLDLAFAKAACKFVTAARLALGPTHGSSPLAACVSRRLGHRLCQAMLGELLCGADRQKFEAHLAELEGDIEKAKQR
jgi:hypothetical protein